MFVLFVIFFFCFCKQKTAYELRISDWSSDVCSSDLLAQRDMDGHGHDAQPVGGQHHHRGDAAAQGGEIFGMAGMAEAGGIERRLVDRIGDHGAGLATAGKRSEEHASELQSLMRISYAVFCLKKKKHKT